VSCESARTETCERVAAVCVPGQHQPSAHARFRCRTLQCAVPACCIWYLQASALQVHTTYQEQLLLNHNRIRTVCLSSYAHCCCYCTTLPVLYCCCCCYCCAEWFFKFGYVIPGSTNSWQQTIKAAPQEQMKCAKELSGRVTIETSFYDGKVLIAKTLVRVFYV
jgi:GMP-PDE, delta subunit